jgi:hypothetical protein
MKAGIRWVSFGLAVSTRTSRRDPTGELSAALPRDS